MRPNEGWKIAAMCGAIIAFVLLTGAVKEWLSQLPPLQSAIAKVGGIAVIVFAGSTAYAWYASVVARHDRSLGFVQAEVGLIKTLMLWSAIVAFVCLLLFSGAREINGTPLGEMFNTSHR